MTPPDNTAAPLPCCLWALLSASPEDLATLRTWLADPKQGLPSKPTSLAPSKQPFGALRPVVRSVWEIPAWVAFEGG